MICPKCGSTQQDYMEYCTRCGTLFKSDEVDKIASKLSVDGYLHYYFKEYARGDALKKLSLRYLLLPFNIPFLDHMPFTSINLMLIVMHALFALVVLWKYSGPFAALYILVSILLIPVYYIYNIFTYNKKRLDNAFTRINKIKRDNPEDKVDELCTEDGKGNRLVFWLSFLFVPVILFLWRLFLYFITNLSSIFNI